MNDLRTILAIGDVLADRTLPVTRETLVRYAGASGDVNPIHYRDDVARAAGLPGVIAQGMLTMGMAVGVVVDALGDPSRIVSCGCRFARPVPVDGDDGADLHVTARVTKADEEWATVAIDVVYEGVKVLVKALAVVRQGTNTEGA